MSKCETVLYNTNNGLIEGQEPWKQDSGENEVAVGRQSEQCRTKAVACRAGPDARSTQKYGRIVEIPACLRRKLLLRRVASELHVERLQQVVVQVLQPATRCFRVLRERGWQQVLRANARQRLFWKRALQTLVQVAPDAWQPVNEPLPVAQRAAHVRGAGRLREHCAGRELLDQTTAQGAAEPRLGGASGRVQSQCGQQLERTQPAVFAGGQQRRVERRDVEARLIAHLVPRKAVHCIPNEKLVENTGKSRETANGTLLHFWITLLSNRVVQ